MRSAYRVIAYAIAVFVALQAAWVALSAFGVIHAVDTGTVVDKDFEPNVGAMLHGIGGMYVIPLLALALLVVSFFAKVPRGVRWALFVLLAVVVQVVVAFVAFGVPALGVLHGLNAFVILGLAAAAGLRSREKKVAAPEPVTDRMVA